MAKMYYDKDADLGVLEEKTIAVIGYGNQGSSQALNMRDSGLEVIIGAKKGKGFDAAKEAGFDVMPIDAAVKKAQIVHVLIPDEVQGRIYKESIEKNLDEGNAIMFSHGFNIRFKAIVPPENVDVLMVAPKGPGILVRQTYVDGFGTPAVFAIEQNYTGEAKNIALAVAKALGSTRAGVLETTFAEETETDLFGEQVDLCGGSTELVKASFQTLIEAGYQSEIAYFETLHELKLIVDLVQRGGIEYMWKMVSNTAEYGGRTRGKRIIDDHVKKNMKEILKEIQSGKFAKEWMDECAKGMPNLGKMRKEEADMQIETVGSGLRKMFSKK